MTQMKPKRDRKKLIEEFIKYSGMSREQAEFAAGIELGKYPTGDVMTVRMDKKRKKKTTG